MLSCFIRVLVVLGGDTADKKQQIPVLCRELAKRTLSPFQLRNLHRDCGPKANFVKLHFPNFSWCLCHQSRGVAKGSGISGLGRNNKNIGEQTHKLHAKSCTKNFEPMSISPIYCSIMIQNGFPSNTSELVEQEQYSTSTVCQARASLRRG